jgi:UDP-N-acetyl-D-mannosaminuronic acid dehydrogenase
MSRSPDTSNIAALCVTEKAPLSEVLERQAQATQLGLPAGIALVVDGEKRLIGAITDGDVRRALLKHKRLDLSAGEAMTRNPIAFAEGTSYRKILRGLPGELEQRGRRSRRFLGKIILVDEARRPTRVLDYHELWEQRVATHRHVVVVGLGYVGLTLALELAREGIRVTGVDADQSRVDQLGKGQSYVHEIGLPELLREQLGKTFTAQTTLPDDGDVFIISVGTPVDGTTHKPILSYLEGASREVGKRLRRGSLVVLRSTVPVGCTRDVVLPLLEQASGLFAERDFHLAFAPERTAEGKALSELRSLPQIIGGLGEDSVEATAALFRELSPTLVRVESLEAAELIKLINNSFRDLVFAFANQMVQLAQPFNLDVVELIRAANRDYPRDRVPLPSPGVGGPCLTKDPYILASVAERAGLTTTLAASGRAANEAMHGLVADALCDRLVRLGKDPKKARVVLCGLAFKGHPETGDLRNSTSLEIAERLRPRVGQLVGHDPVATADEIRAFGLEPVSLPAGFAGADAVVFLNNHRAYEKLDVYAMVRALRGPGIVYDGWHAFSPDDVLAACPSVYMGLGFVRSSVAERP